MIKIRKGVFETNSSSSHSIALTKKKMNAVKTLDDALNEDESLVVNNNKIIISDESELEFGWGFEILDTFYGRLKYAIASLCQYNDREESMEKILSAVQKNFPEIQEIVLPNETGYIDHQSVGTFGEFISHYNGTLADYLVDPNIMVIIDNDNESVFGDFVSSGLFDKDGLEDLGYAQEDLVDDYDTENVEEE